MTAPTDATRVARMTMPQLASMAALVPVYPDVAAALGMSRPALYKAAKDGTLPVPVVTLPHTRGRFCRRADIFAFLGLTGLTGLTDEGTGVAAPVPPVEAAPAPTGTHQ